jgi:LAO/AO transport system kinase
MLVTAETIRSGQRRALAKGITLIESLRAEDRERAQNLLGELLPYTGNSIRIGITGVPGVGKSTFIESFGLHLLNQGKRVAVLAVDPSSPLAGGSILGDKTRMELLSRAENAFIRPSPAGSTLGGVAQRTRETMLLCEAAGFDVILVETVGVGQSEHQVAGMVDFFMLLMLPGGGDELQGIKKGILELADALIINKADGESLGLAKQARQHYQNAMHLLRHEGQWIPQVQTCSALKNEGISDVWEMILEFWRSSDEAGELQHAREAQRLAWLRQLIQEGLQARFSAHPGVKAAIPEIESQVADQQITTYTAAKRVLDLFS